MSRLFENAAKAASYNIVLQVSMRILTFVLNAFILRFVSPDVLGIINVRLLLLYTTCQFLSREAFRRACLSNVKDLYWPQVINLLWLTIPLSITVGSALRLSWIYLLFQPDESVLTDYQFGASAIVASIVIEMLAEPLFIIGQAFNYIRLRVIIEGAVLAVRCIIMAAFILFLPNRAIYIFGWAQVVSSILYTSLYYWYFHTSMQQNTSSSALPFKSLWYIFPGRLKDKAWTDVALVALTWSFLKQTFLKQLLTEGERYMMTLFNALDFAEQGVYDVVNNLGSLAARFLFHPIEESGYMFFAQLVKRNVAAKQLIQEDLKLASRVLENLVKVMLLLGLTILTFGYSFSQLLLLLYGGKRLSLGLGSVLLRWHCLYVVFIALNGITESFVFAAMSKADINRYNFYMVLMSFGFLFSSYYLVRFLGSVGFIIANCINMGTRIVHSWHFINRYFEGSAFSPLQNILPHPVVLTTYGLSFIILAISEAYLCCNHFPSVIIHILLGVLCLASVFLAIVSKEKSLIGFVYEQWKEHEHFKKMATNVPRREEEMPVKKLH